MAPDPASAQSSPVANLPLRELASGVDALYLSGRAALPRELLARLEDRRQVAEGTSVPIPFDLGDSWFTIAPHGWGKYRYCLDHPEVGRVGFTTSRNLPADRVQPLSSFLHTSGPAGAVERVGAILEPVCGPVALAVSRLDLYADFEGWNLGADDRSRFVCRADAMRTFELDGQLSGLQFGNRKTKTIVARIYDKTADVERTGHDWWFDVWGRTSASGGTVRRVEFELNRAGLSQFGLAAPTETLVAAGDVWRYCSSDWLTHRSPTTDANRSRWPISEEWGCVQRATIAQRTVGAERITRQLRCGSLRKITPGLVGYMVTFAVLSRSEGLDDTLAALGHHVRQDEIDRRFPFSERVRRRRLEGRLP